jgi:hypothetical protein
MKTQEEQIVQVLEALVRDEGADLERRHGTTALARAREIETALVPHLRGRPMYDGIWSEFRQEPGEATSMLVEAVKRLLGANAVLSAQIKPLLKAFRQATGASTEINTGGGAYVGGNVEVKNGDFVGRDKHTTTTRITGDGNVVGNDSSATVIKQQGADATAIAQAFADLYTAVAQQRGLSPAAKADVQAELQEVETEIRKGQGADEGFIRRRLRSIRSMAPDIYDVIITTFANPVAGLGMVARKVAEKMRAEAEAE